ncbi:uncharacterized protein JCM10292_005627 [Rhodotorula paludigena]|uniref:uncharacterized protein n=1 Tax=Rhodotorula paludigena TaxID=86838 RepID=UPI0031822932
MHLVKPSWVAHPDEQRPTKPDLTIFSLDVHPDGSRVATGGLDSLVRVWSTVPILTPAAENDDRCPKLLSTLSAHTGVVMSVRWNNAGSYLATGSDDRVVVIWAHEGGGGGKVWGTETTNVENWKATRRLVGHNSDVAGVAWSPDDAYCASVGLDNVVLVWSGHTFELVRKLDQHQGFVKGLVFDPVGQYLATQSDDNSLKIWRTDDWQLQADIREPFEDAPKATVIRPTWSPDGAYIVTPNSMNGPVFCAAVVDRTTWKSPASLIGHPDIVQAAAYNPLVFLRDASQPASMTNVCSLLALCAQGTISLWFTDLSQPFAVFTDLFDRDVLDLSWSRDGAQLWASSSDGQIAVLSFDKDTEFAPVAPAGAKAALHATYGYVPRNRPVLSAAASFVGAGGATPRPGTPANGEGTLAQPKQLVARKGAGAKRPRTVQLQQPQAPAGQASSPFANAPTYAAPGQAPPAMQVPMPMPMPMQQGGVQASAYASTLGLHPQQPQQYAPAQMQMQQPYPHMLPLPLQQPQMHPQQAYAPAPGFGAPLPPHSAAAAAGGGGGGSAHVPSRKRKASRDVGLADAAAPLLPPAGYAGAPHVSQAEYRLQGHTLGSAASAAGAAGEELRELVPAYALHDREVTFRVTNGAGAGASAKGKEREGAGARSLAVPAVVSQGKVQVEEGEGKDALEWRNFAQGQHKGQSEVRVATSKKTLWIDYLPKFVVLAAGSPVFTAVCLEDGSLVAWSPTGRRLIPTLVLDAPCSFLVAEGPYLLAITALGTLAVWNLSPSIPKPRSIYPPLSITSLVSSCASRAHPHPEITTSALLPNGTPLVALSSGATFSYDADLAAWTRVCEPWWSRSDAWEGRRAGRHGAASHAGRGIVKNVESAVNEIVVDAQANGEGADDNDDESTEGGDEGEKGEGAAEKDVEMNGDEGAKGKEKAEGDDGEDEGAASRVSKRRRSAPQGSPAEPTGSNDDYRTAISLAHLETRLLAAAALDSPSEYRNFLLQYAKKLADEGLRSKAVELIRELLGPIYHKPGKKEEDEWSPTVLGLAKRDLLRDVLREFAKQRVTAPLATEYQDLLKKITAA